MKAQDIFIDQAYDFLHLFIVVKNIRILLKSWKILADFLERIE